MASAQSKIDHLIYTSPSLEEGMDQIESMLGIRPVIGGRHEQWGTHNALLSLGEAYLEVVSPCPDLPVPQKGLWLEEYLCKPPHLATWALQTTDIQLLHANAINHEIELGEIQKGQRQKPDGTLLTWQLTDPYPLPIQGAIPFLIDWGNSLHPSQTTPKAGELVELIISTPEPDKLSKAMETLKINITIQNSEIHKMEARIQTNKGLISLN